MRNTIILLIIGIILMFIGSTLISFVSPFDINKINDLILEKDIKEAEETKLNQLIIEEYEKGRIVEYLSANFYVVVTLFTTGFFLIVYSIHIFVDKLFFKNYFEKPSIYLAFRRTFLLTSTLLSLFILNLYFGLRPTLLLVPLLAILLEIFINLNLPDSKVNEIIEKIKEARKSYNERSQEY